MKAKPKVYTYKTLRKLVTRLRDDLNNQDFVLLYAYNGTGKTRLSMEFKEAGKQKKGVARDTLYFNAFTEDLFYWDNDLNNDTERHIKINSDSKFFSGFQQLALEEKIFAYLGRYTDLDFKIDYKTGKLFSLAMAMTLLRCHVVRRIFLYGAYFWLYANWLLTKSLPMAG